MTNPAGALVALLTALKDEHGRIQVPGFYDEVVPLTERERDEFRSLPLTDAEFMKSLGVTGMSGEAEYTSLERRWARPTCDINGLTSGYQGEGAKTVLPARASAKFSFRLVPNQDPKKISASLRKFLEQRLPPGIEMELIDFHGAPGVVVSLDSPYMQSGGRGDSRRLRQRAGLYPRRRIDPDRHHFCRRTRCGCAAIGLGPERRQHA